MPLQTISQNCCPSEFAHLSKFNSQSHRENPHPFRNHTESKLQTKLSPSGSARHWGLPPSSSEGLLLRPAVGPGGNRGVATDVEPLQEPRVLNGSVRAPWSDAYRSFFALAYLGTVLVGEVTCILLRKEGEKDYSPFMLLPGLVFLIVCLTKPELLKAPRLKARARRRRCGSRFSSPKQCRKILKIHHPKGSNRS